MNLDPIPDEAWEALFSPGLSVPKAPVATVVRPAIPVRPMTVIVAGAFRGGTSYIAELLNELGVPMGDVWSTVTPREDYVSYEDAELAIALDPLAENFHKNQGDYLPLLTELIAERNAKYDLWGFKKPSTVFFIDRILSCFRNPHIITIIRDPLASHQSATFHGVTEPGRMSIPDCRAHFSAVMDLVDRPRCPTLATSFERSRSRRDEMKTAIKEFLEL